MVSGWKNKLQSAIANVTPAGLLLAASRRMAAPRLNLGRTQTALGAFYRRVAFRKAKAVTATARKLTILVYRTLKDASSTPTLGLTRLDAEGSEASTSKTS